eukprot:scaffold189_cov118-Isochrysis_galbana.AAC.10
MQCSSRPAVLRVARPACCAAVTRAGCEGTDRVGRPRRIIPLASDPPLHMSSMLASLRRPFFTNS